MSTTALNPRTSRTPGGGEQHYIIAAGAPQHYVDGYGLVFAGGIVTLPKGVKPGRWYGKISSDDADKAFASESHRQYLAAVAGEAVKDKANAEYAARVQSAQGGVTDKAEVNAELSSALAAETAAADLAASEKLRADGLQLALEGAQKDLAAAEALLAESQKKLGATEVLLSDATVAHAETLSKLEKATAAEVDKAKGEGKQGK